MTKSFDQIGAFACTFVWSTQTATDCQNKSVLHKWHVVHLSCTGCLSRQHASCKVVQSAKLFNKQNVCTNDMLCILAAQAAYQDNTHLVKLCKVQNCSTSKVFAQTDVLHCSWLCCLFSQHCWMWEREDNRGAVAAVAAAVCQSCHRSSVWCQCVDITWFQLAAKLFCQHWPDVGRTIRAQLLKTRMVHRSHLSKLDVFDVNMLMPLWLMSSILNWLPAGQKQNILSLVSIALYQWVILLEVCQSWSWAE